MPRFVDNGGGSIPADSIEDGMKKPKRCGDRVNRPTPRSLVNVDLPKVMSIHDTPARL